MLTNWTLNHKVKQIAKIMAWLDVKWQLNAWRSNERDDEEGLQFAIISIDLGRRKVMITTHNTGSLSHLGGSEVYGGRIQVPTFRITGRGWFGIPDSQKPYLGLVVRAIEYDSSSRANRDKDTADFIEALQNGVQEVVNEGRTPTSEELLSFGTSVGLRDRRFRDDDDLIGVLAYAYPDFGARVDEEIHRETEQGLSDFYYLAYLQSGRFRGEDAIWSFSSWPVILTGDPSESSAEYKTQERYGWWLFTP